MIRIAGRPSSIASRASRQDSSGSAAVRSRSGAPVSSRNCSSSRPVRPLENRDGFESSITK